MKNNPLMPIGGIYYLKLEIKQCESYLRGMTSPILFNKIENIKQQIKGAISE